MRVIYAAALLAAVSATPAFAQAFNGGNLAVVGGYDHASFGSGSGTSGSGVMYGVGAGWDIRSGNAAFGIQLEAADSTTQNCNFGPCVEAGRDLYAGLRAGGVLPSGKTLLYVLAGYSNARVSIAGCCHSDLDGIRAGLGIEHQPGPHWFFGFEGRYTNYQQSFERWQGVARVGYRF